MRYYNEKTAKDLKKTANTAPQKVFWKIARHN